MKTFVITIAALIAALMVLSAVLDLIVRLSPPAQARGIDNELAAILNESDERALATKLSIFNNCSGPVCLIPGTVVRLNRIERKLDELAKQCKSEAR